MARMHTWIVVSLVSFAAVGCVSTEQYKAARMDADQYAQRLAAAERAKSEADAARDAYKSQLDNVALGTNSKDALVQNLNSQLNALQQENADLKARYARAAGREGTTVVLPQQLNDALNQFAQQFPDIIEYDQARGIVKFRSDVTFAPGSANLTSNAQNVIDKFAGIVNSAAANGYDLMVVGHTDNTRVAHEATVRAGHKDNWYLSAHRAISVSEEMQRKGVSSGRLEVAGFADQRPIASNSTEEGKARNRRVEVLILPSTSHSAVASSPAAPARTSRAAAQPGLNKDENKDFVDTTDSRKPAFNK
ncbi:MAG TPA: OmpA family protein [Tepidisphaeraceae bacterium]|nr:OmpA family protein [Tepidisphaeraceae bacterium]